MKIDLPPNEGSSLFPGERIEILASLILNRSPGFDFARHVSAVRALRAYLSPTEGAVKVVLSMSIEVSIALYFEISLFFFLLELSATPSFF